LNLQSPLANSIYCDLRSAKSDTALRLSLFATSSKIARAILKPYVIISSSA